MTDPNTDETISNEILCGTCLKPIHFTVNSNSGLWYHDHSGQWMCDRGGDANTVQIHPGEAIATPGQEL